MKNYLKVNHNIITDLGARSFEGLPKLTSLSLDYNKIRAIDKDAFVGLAGKFLVIFTDTYFSEKHVYEC